MTNLTTTYLGLKLKNPIIVSSSGLTSTPEKIRKIEENGAGAVVLKSLFEEQIRYEANQLLSYNEYPEASDYITNYSKDNSVNEYLKLIEECKKIVSIPIIASINCISSEDWIEFAKKIEKSGADALELNIYILACDTKIDAKKQEEAYYKIVSKVRKNIKIPIAVKISNHFTNLVNFVEQLNSNGANSVVLFNRFYEPDIDIENLKMSNFEVFSSQTDIKNTLRWVGILSSKKLKIQISASTGIHDGKSVIKLLLAGADTVQICSTLYKNGLEYIKTILEFIDEWIYRKGFNSIDEFRGKMNNANIKEPIVYERVQFMKHFSSFE